PAWGIALLLLVVTSPAEEIFWRGVVQRSLMRKLPPFQGFFLAALCYAGVHLCTLNLPLVLAAFMAGVFWGGLYIAQKSLVPVIISHALWSVTVFLIFPFG
ncbi:CPBP family intramembrane metalloprotease, partial [candidate division KSB3 bacterium]|nr:CPBP family intramembrane metalloprotease [candidate division KSB3 bacterium]MBD3327453.1 CPBP family intramembrane metalloprotease [candidate division KSB3 bacterium]